MRGRNNRKGPNPLTRAYESNGPDVKIRGTAQHIAEKYLQLARDAQSSGDPVVAENFLQHAEHYFRIIAAAQAAQQQAHLGFNRSAEDFEELDDDDDFVALPDRFASPFERSAQAPVLNQPQPNVAPSGFGGQPQPFFERPAFAPDQQERVQDRPERGNRGERRFGPQGERPQNHGRQRFREQQGRFEAAPTAQEQPRIDFEPTNPGLPAFITSPTRAPAMAPVASSDEIAPASAQREIASAPEQTETAAHSSEAAAPQSQSESDTRFHLRPRRRRRPRAESDGDANDGTPVAEANSAE
ncbi:DUF4167 domain-containing protein [Rhodoblastus acidophilus]|nr:DUF4167 domain-containing protein [Rhodoblastus acidophilus]